MGNIHQKEDMMKKRLETALTILMVLAVLVTYSVPYVGFADTEGMYQQEVGSELDGELHDLGGNVVFAPTAKMLDASSGKWVVKAVKEWNYPGKSKWPCKKWMAYNTADKDDEIVAYCLQPDLVGPVDSVGSSHTYSDSNVTSSLESDVKKCLYYCYGYPGWDELKDVIDKEMKGTDFSPSKSGYAASSQYYMCCHILLALFYYDNTSVSSKAFDGIDTDAYADERDAFRAVYSKIKNFDGIPSGDMGIRLKKGSGSYTSGSIDISSSEMKYSLKSHDMTVGGITHTVPAKKFVTPRITVSCNSKDRVKVKILKDSKMKIVRDAGTTDARILNRTYGDTDSAYIDDSNFTQLRDGDIFWYEVDETRTSSYSGSIRSMNESFMPFMAKCSGKQTIAFAATESKDSVKLSVAFPTGAIRVYKGDDGSCSETKDNPSYDLSGAVFEISYDGEKPVKVTADKKSSTNEGQYFVLKKDMHFGSYDIREVKAPSGYELDDTLHNVVVDKEYVNTSDAAVATFLDAPVLKTFSLSVEKVDSETGEPAPQNGSFEGAVYEVDYMRDEKAEPDRTWYLTTDENGRASLPEEECVLPYGILSVKEIEAPSGYALSDEVKNINLTSDDEVVFTHTSKEPVIRGDFELKKTEMFTDRPMAGVAFRITNLDTGESHIIVTDENGCYSSLNNKNTNRTNENDKAVKDGKVDETMLDPHAGIWFGEETAAADDRGALLYGSYEVRELRSGSNRAKMLALPIRFMIDMDGEVESAGTIENRGMMIKTHASDEVTGTHDGFAKNDEVFIDELEYQHAVKGTEYTVTTTAKNVRTGEPLLDDGKEARSVTTFKAEDEDGTIKVRFTADTEGMDGEDIVIFENITYVDKDGNTEEAAFEEELDNRDQTVTLHVPHMGTTANDEETGENISDANEDVTIVDRVEYTGLIPGLEYTVKGTLMDRETGKALKDIKAEKKFTPDTADGYVDMVFKFDGKVLKGDTVVVFEKIYVNDREVICHEDLSDEGQSIHFPELGTTASKDGSEKNITDVVHYENLIPGKEYVVEGTLMDKKSGEEVISDGKKITGKTVFTPDKKSGDIDVRFDISGADLNGKDVVVFETMYVGEIRDENTVGEHRDIHSKSQTVTFKAPNAVKTGIDMTLIVLFVVSFIGMMITIFFRRKNAVK